MSLRDYLPIKRRLPSCDEKAAKKTRLDDDIAAAESALKTTLRGGARVSSTESPKSTATLAEPDVTPELRPSAYQRYASLAAPSDLSLPNRPKAAKQTILNYDIVTPALVKPALKTSTAFSGGQTGVEKPHAQQPVMRPGTPQREPAASAAAQLRTLGSVESSTKKRSFSHLPAYQRYASLAASSDLSLPVKPALTSKTTTIASGVQVRENLDVQQEQPATPPRSPEKIPDAPVTPPRSPEKIPDAPPQLRRFRAFTVESPTKKSQLPAYQRYASLVATGDLPIPSQYKVLNEKFRCTDMVVNMLQKRDEVCTLSKLKKAVPDMMRRAFEQRNLAQMKTVFPTAFVFRQEKGIPGVYLDAKDKQLYQLTIECGGLGDRKSLDSAALVERTQTFKNGLLKIVIHHHKSFLNSRSPPIHIPDDKLVRWHPQFDLDSIPDVEEAELPKPPLTDSYTTAKDVLAAAHGRFAAKLQRALANSSASETCDGETSAPCPAGGMSVPPPPQVDPTLDGISPLLLERIRQKEAAKATAVMTRDPAVEKKLCMLEKLPDICRIVKTFFVSEQKVALLLDEVVAKVSESSGVSKESVEGHVNLMREVLPEWVNLVSIRKRDYLKISKNVDIKTIISALEQKRKEALNE